MKIRSYLPWTVKATYIALFFFVFLELLSGNLIFAGHGAISGVIQKITSLEGNRFELVIETTQGTSTFMVDSSTLVQAVIPAKQVKAGRKIVIPPGKEKKGMRGMKAPFRGMSQSAKKQLGLPDVPEIPKVSDIPNVPQVPKIPDIIKKSKLSQTLAGANAATAAKAPTSQLPSSIGGPPEGANQPVSQAGGNQGSQTKTPKKPVEEDVKEPPKSAGFPGLEPDVLSPPTVVPPMILGKKVVEAKKTRHGIEIRLEGNEAIVFSPDEVVVELLTIDDLRKNMNVSLEISEDSSGKLVRRIVIA